MVTKVLPVSVRGRMDLFSYHGLYRLTSRATDGVFSWFDLEAGFDEFIPNSVNDDVLGALISECLDSARKIPCIDFKVQKSLLKEWHRKAFKTTGAPDLATLWGGAKCVFCTKTDEFSLFTNAHEVSRTNISTVADADPKYWECTLKTGAQVSEIGRVARLGLEKMVGPS